MAVRLKLGDITFQDFEVPEQIDTGMSQQLVVHKLPGGARVIDDMGQDPEAIEWTGRFRGPQAEKRAKRLEIMAEQGARLSLSWSSYRFQVVIRSFKPSFQQPFEIPYRITCEVVSNESTPLLSLLPGVALAVLSDLTAAIGFSNQLQIPDITTAMTGLSTSVNAVASQFNLAAAPAASVAAMQQAIGAVQIPVLSGITANNALLAPTQGLAGLVSGADPSKAAAGLLASAKASVNMGQLLPMQSTLQRMATNVGNLGF